MGIPGIVVRVGRGFSVVAAVWALTFAMPIGTASAQGMFDFFFGHRRPPPQANAYADPYAPPAAPRPPHMPSEGSSHGGTYCVRLCDGRYFPMQSHAGASPARLCQAFCPAARTKIYSGSAINHAVARDGTRYADLENAFLYREKVVADCTCNGKDPFGLVRVQVTSDPTLRPGDVVATEGGLAAVHETGRTGASFTSIEDYSGASDDVRRKLSEVKVTPAPPGTRTVVVAAEAPPAPARTAERVAEQTRPPQAYRPRSFWDFFRW